jgi:carboxyl-terminal processing protease
MSPKEQASELASFELVWSTVRDHNPDAGLNGLDWQALHDSFRTRVTQAKSVDEVRDVLREMISRLGVSHYGVIPGEAYTAPAPVKSESGNMVAFGNLPNMRLEFESRALAGGVGYIRFNEFLDPVSLMPNFEAALRGFGDAPGVILDLRGNPGGIGIMASGVAGFFIGEAGKQLGQMKMRDPASGEITTLKLAVFPRANVFAGRVAVLIDGGSASTAEIFAQGMKDLKRARIFGTRSAGAALASDIIRLPDGDGFQYPTASYTSASGRVLEGNGVIPDVEVREGSEAVIDAAVKWIRQP